MDVSRDDVKAQAMKNVEKGRRVGAAGKGHQNPLSRPEHLMRGDGCGDAFQEGPHN